MYYFMYVFLSVQAYYRQGVALQHMGRHADSLAAFSSSLAQDPKSLQLLAGLVEAAMKSPLRSEYRMDFFSVASILCLFPGFFIMK